MRNVEKLNAFLEEVENEKSVIFDYKKVSSFEREIYMSIHNLLNKNYSYELKGMSTVHYDSLREEVPLEEKDVEIIETGFQLSSMITSRTTSFGYGSHTAKTIKNYKLDLFIEVLKKFIALNS
ncbi:hypothetical protein [Paenibacillus crassostreae]|uniref:Uncharacterized protein n=1 Tax=Paenibacillus crassostreae TaxID=1763538 RepID=A0A167BEP3_9BACL|nr:hypothetical protein [Paenibacillus crassostreae]AOZ92906.1 hypothetical protein LPB68_12225 [Paenibacillus crassostreae]OAB72004.1 hypothetical protein PNBC_18665 [Paenibacillus crassostreae]